MGKLKTKRNVKKRFRLKKKGKVVYHKACKSHILTKKSNKRKRDLRRMSVLSTDSVKLIRRCLPYG